VFMEAGWIEQDDITSPKLAIEPCIDSKLTDTAAEACWAYVPGRVQFYSRSVGDMGVACDKAPFGRNRDACFSMVGQLLTAGAVRECGLMPTSDDKVTCVAGWYGLNVVQGKFLTE